MNQSTLKFWLRSILHSYSQVFFSLNKYLASTILVLTFFDPSIGLWGLAAVLGSNLLAYALGFDKQQIELGIYGFNALLLGLALGYLYQFSSAFLLLFAIAICAVFFITASLQASMSKVKLPFLSFPFLLCYWLIALASPQLSALSLKPIWLIKPMFEPITFPTFWAIFFKTLAATFFIKSIFGGFLIAVALFVASRIAFSLAVIGYVAAYFSYQLFGAGVEGLTENLVGSNFIFFGIAIGCFFLIPNIFSYGAVVILTPLLMLMVLGLNRALALFQLNGFTIAFSLLTMLILYALHHRWIPRFLLLVQVQYYSPETTIYKYLNAIKRLKFAFHKKLSLPFYGNWLVSQAYNGNQTHLGDWRFALDFVISDAENKTYDTYGTEMHHFYCYNKPVLAPEDGLVVQIINHIEDNEVGEVDTRQNWGNTIILKHGEGLYSQISHIKKDSFKVNEGAWVNKGAVLANCGSSGRSPEPHIHFQMQREALVGSKTLEYPLAYFMSSEKGKMVFNYFEVPKMGQQVCNVEVNPLLKQAFQWQPGKKMLWHNTTMPEVLWSIEVFTDAYNRTYLYCHETKASAYFVNDGTRVYFTEFSGKRKGLLFQLYLSCFNVLQAIYPNLKMQDNVPQIDFQFPVLHWFQDLLAPFYTFLKVKYESENSLIGNQGFGAELVIESKISSHFWGFEMENRKGRLKLNKEGLYNLSYTFKGKSEEWQCVN